MGSPTLRLARIALYLLWTLSLMPVQGLGLILRRPWAGTLPVLYHRWCGRILGFRIRTIGAPTSRRPVLFASNHVSYTDITILGSLITGSFVAKAEVAGGLSSVGLPSCSAPSLSIAVFAARSRSAMR